MTEIKLEDFYELVGGEPFFRALVDDFYAGVSQDPVLLPMYPPEDMAGANQRLRLFLMQYWGGPSEYHELRGHPRLRMRHAPFAVDANARDHWLQHMMKSVANRKLPPELERVLTDYLVQVAHTMVNVIDSADRPAGGGGLNLI